MMKLRYLFDNRDLVTMLLENWNYDKENTNLLDRFRISANAVYPFTIDGELHFLRFASVAEKSEVDLLAELDFIEYLENCGYPAANIVQTKKQSRFIHAETPWGDYLAVVFKGVPGKQIGSLPYSDDLYFGYGKALGQLHKLSQNYKPLKAVRSDWKHRLHWTKETLLEYSAPDDSIYEVDILLEFLSNIEADKNNYGLIHYDFEFDNVFFNEADKKYSIIDFDDSVYHWFAMDIEQSIDSIRCEIPAKSREKAEDSFLSGYQCEMTLSNDMKKLLPVFKRYADVFGYARCLRSIHETWNNEPKWMSDLRNVLQSSMAERQKNFGNKIRL
jgi:Ser/Thr protein kinase RdoA (MazF antagonist)